MCPFLSNSVVNKSTRLHLIQNPKATPKLSLFIVTIPTVLTPNNKSRSSLCLFVWLQFLSAIKPSLSVRTLQFLILRFLFFFFNPKSKTLASLREREIRIVESPTWNGSSAASISSAARSGADRSAKSS